jgi:exodeoxyribonuclease V beta subunit
MDKNEEFDIACSPISGRNLIEASAGTGKTYTISRIFIRLIIEKQIDINGILAVTFTEAATEELKNRIRLLLHEVRSAFENTVSSDEFIAKLIRHNDRNEALERINAALRNFDSASIYTIHGFCRRILRHNAFECNQTFDAQIITDQKAIFEEIADDFWRKNFLKASPVFINYILSRKIRPCNLLYNLRRFCTQQTFDILPVRNVNGIGQLESDFIDKTKKAGDLWEKSKAEIRIMLQSDSLNKTKYSPDIVETLLSDMESFFGSDTASPSLFADFAKFTKSVICQSVKKNKPQISHGFFDACEDLAITAEKLKQAYDAWIASARCNFIGYAFNELASRKEKLNVLYFDDLLIKVAESLRNIKKDGRLADEIRREFKAGLIDEFQDTDPVQYAIFNALFPEGSTLFLIGDPKQAIYSFRGADIFAYLKASSAVDNIYTLRTNYRSSPDLVNAVNAIFSARNNPFVYDSIRYHDILPASGSAASGHITGSFELWMLQRDPSKVDKQTGTAEARKMAGKAVASGIHELVNSDPKKTGNGHVKLSDIAVLVRRNSEADFIRSMLAAEGIRATIDSTGSVFNTREAGEMYCLLIALHDVSQQKLCRAALATVFFGLAAREIYELSESRTRWEELLMNLHEYHAIWNRSGHISMIRTLMSRENVRSRTLGLADGERIMTNLLHISELIHKEERMRKLTPGAVCSWLASKISQSQDSVHDEEITRLESDENAVRIITIHKSKGLEYPVVFCPFLWDSSEISKRRKAEPILFHDPVSDNKQFLAIDAENIEKNRHITEKELLSENIRIMYVALTRAKKRCYVAWGNISGAETSAFAWLLSGADTKGLDDLKSLWKNAPDELIRERLTDIARRSGGGINIYECNDEKSITASRQTSDPEMLSCRSFDGTIPKPWTTASFTYLMYSSLDTDDGGLESLEQEHTSGIFAEIQPSGLNAFPRGTRTGIFFHDILQNIDFTAVASQDAEKLVKEKLIEYDFDISWQKTISDFLNILVKTKIDGVNGSIMLSNIRPSAMIREMEFYFPLNRITASQLDTVLSDKQDDFSKSRFNFSPVEGFMKGFMDCIFEFDGKFYLIDWKSNFIGPSFSDYGITSIASVMKKEGYDLQYLIYITALNEFLAGKKPDYDYERHFGGAAYIFLRGICEGCDGKSGIYFCKPEKEKISDLKRLMIGS